MSPRETSMASASMPSSSSSWKAPVPSGASCPSMMLSLTLAMRSFSAYAAALRGGCEMTVFAEDICADTQNHSNYVWS